MEADDENSLAMLRNPMTRVDHSVYYFIAQRIERRHNHVKGPAVVVRNEILHVFQEDDRWLLSFEQTGNLEKQVALGHVLKAMLPAQAQFLTNTRNAERLARKAGSKHLMIGQVFDEPDV